MTRLALTAFTACLLAAPVMAAQGPAPVAGESAATVPGTVIAACPGKKRVDA